MRRAVTASALLCAVLAAVGCDEEPLTELVLVVDTTLDTPLEADLVTISVEGPGGRLEEVQAPLAGPAAVSFPLTIGLTPRGGSLEPVTITVVATVLDVFVVERRVQTGFVAGERRMVRLLLLPECIPVTCPPGQTCGEGGGCRSEVVPGSSLPVFRSVPPSPDPRDLCAAGRSNAVATIGCNGPPPGPDVPSGAFGGICDPAMEPACTGGAYCLAAAGAAYGMCLLNCDPADTYVSTGGCPLGARCFDLGGRYVCYPDCLTGDDCASGSCDREGSCLPPAPDAPDAGVPDAG